MLWIEIHSKFYLFFIHNKIYSYHIITKCLDLLFIGKSHLIEIWILFSFCVRKIHLNIIFIQFGIKSILNLEFNKLFYYWQLINQSRCQFITFFSALGGSDKNRLCYFKEKKNEIHIIGHQSKKQTGIIVEEEKEENTRLIKSINITLCRE